MKFYSIIDLPIKIYGLAVKDAAQRKFYKLPEEMLEKMPRYDYLGRRACGGRVRFATNAKSMVIRMTLAGTKEDINIPLSGSAGADVYLGVGKSSKFIGYIAPKEHVTEEVMVEKEFSLVEEESLGQPEGADLNQEKTNTTIVTINLPRNDHLLAMEIGIEEGAIIEEAPEYTIDKPIVFYGSSITEGGCASRAGNAYTSIVCRWLDTDYYNYGFSGSAKGESVFAEYIAGLENISALVYDYDHNAPTPEHLEETHEAFFKIIRKAKPELPVLMLSRPDLKDGIEDAAKRAEIIRKTYQNAVDSGDKNVWFLDGRIFFGEEGREECTVDGTHPNALGFMRMAEKIYPVLKEILL